jgi:manganese-dependent ADP-ribose/CDP-alcohol diphosphatase
MGELAAGFKAGYDGDMISRRRFLAASVTVAVAGPFLMGASRRPELRLGLVADPQFADINPRKTRFYRESTGKLTEAVEHFNGLDLAWCVNLGDLIDQRWESFDAIFKPLAQSRHKFHHLLGNHDFNVPDEYKPRVPRRLGLKHRYYSVREGGFCFVMLDTTDVSPYAYAEDSRESAAATVQWQRLAARSAINAQPWNGAVGERQLNWFADTCRRAARAERKVIVFAHHPVCPADAHTEWNADALLKVVERSRNVVAWINGHNHAGAFGVHDDVPFITLKAMVETEKTNAFAVAHLRSDRLELVGHGREPSRELVFRKT